MINNITICYNLYMETNRGRIEKMVTIPRKAEHITGRSWGAVRADVDTLARLRELAGEEPSLAGYLRYISIVLKGVELPPIEKVRGLPNGQKG